MTCIRRVVGERDGEVFAVVPRKRQHPRYRGDIENEENPIKK